MAIVSKPKYQQVADTIEALVRRGKWDGGKMPSVRGVAGQYDVSIVTASRALQVLRDKGLIQTVERSGTFRLPPPSAERWAVVLRLTPGPHRPATVQLSRSGFESLARRRSMHVHFDAFDLDPGVTAEAAVKAARQAKANGIQGVFVLPSRHSAAAAATDATFLAGCVEAELPVVLLERSLRGNFGVIDRDIVALDDTTAGNESTRHLYELGRKRVAIVVASPTSTHNNRVAGYLHACYTARHGRRDPPEFVIRLPDELPSECVSSHLADRVAKDRLDGVVCYQDYLAMGLIIELLNRGIRVPVDVAVSGFDNIDIGNLFPAGLTTYDYPSEAMAEHAVRLMVERIQNPDRPPVRVVVPGRLIVRGSTVSGSV